jgi:ABC-2 type transport system ATP-binding protein
MDIAISTQNLTKTFEQPSGWRRLAGEVRTQAVKEVSLSVPSGELFGLLGPNGAGKTTLVKMLCTLIKPTSGEGSVAGYSLAHSGQIRQAVGLVVSDERSFYWRLSGRRNLRFFAALYNLKGTKAAARINRVLTDLELLADADKPFSNYSTGMRQRLSIARSLLHEPEILFLDEPSRSLDPGATARLHAFIRRLSEERQVTIFLITHDLAEAEKLCHRVAVMNHGRIQTIGQPDQLRNQLAPYRNYVIKVAGINPETEGALIRIAPGLGQEPANGHLKLSFQATETDGTLTAVLDCLREDQVHIYSLDGRPASLEQVFAHYADQEPGSEL